MSNAINAVSGTNETIADIIREMRNLGKLDRTCRDMIPRRLMGLGLQTYADRIEAAAKRELSKNCPQNGPEIGQFAPKPDWGVHEALAFANTLANHGWTREANPDAASSCIYALCRHLRATGNAAAMREALVQCELFLGEGDAARSLPGRLAEDRAGHRRLWLHPDAPPPRGGGEARVLREGRSPPPVGRVVPAAIGGPRAMRLPVKDRRTQPYVSEPEIPAVKALLSEWRRLRREEPALARLDAEFAARLSAQDCRLIAGARLRFADHELALAAALEARLAKEGTAP